MTHEDVTTTCEECGSSIYKQHLDTGIARYEGGRLLCAHCVEEFERSHDGAADDADFIPITLEAHEDANADASAAGMSSTKIHGMSAVTLGTGGAWDESKFTRTADPAGRGATRLRLFHCKLSEGAIDFLNNQVNEWIDGNPGISIKFATSTIGPFEGKHTEPNLILTVFY